MKLRLLGTIFSLAAAAAVCGAPGAQPRPQAGPLAFAEKQISDDLIYDNVKRKLANDADVKGGALEIDVKNGVVTLRGKLETEKLKEKAEKLAKKVTGVKKVDNQITVSMR
jgi:osmotically-inducible protein OsmY